MSEGLKRGDREETYQVSSTACSAERETALSWEGCQRRCHRRRQTRHRYPKLPWKLWHPWALQVLGQTRPVSFEQQALRVKRRSLRVAAALLACLGWRTMRRQEAWFARWLPEWLLRW